MRLTSAHVASARAELARRHLIDFTEQTYPRYRSARHHRIIAEQLERVERREIDRLMLLLPPRHGKTELASRRYPAWNLGRNPHRQIIAASATSDFATDVGREVRNIFDSQEFASVFPGVKLSQDSQAAGRWHTNQGGIFAAVGVGSQVLGKGADDFIIDDPFATMEDAQSEVKRKRVIEWYQGSVYNRLQPNGSIVVINHRMHDDDLTGYLIGKQNDEDGDQWEIVELPAIDDQGDALWPEAYPIEALLRIKANTLPRFWSSLFQQKPQPDEGTFFRVEYLKHWSERPKAMNIYASSDYAVTDEGGDWTCFNIWGVDPKGDLYRLKQWKAQTTPDKWIEEQCAMIREWKPLAWFGEAGVIQKAIEPMLRRRMMETKAHCRLEWVSSISDKPTRARSFQARAAMGKVWFEPGADVGEFLRFPAGRHDDEVDCASMMGRVIDEMHPAIVKTVNVDNNPKPGDYRPRKPSTASSAWG